MGCGKLGWGGVAGRACADVTMSPPLCSGLRGSMCGKSRGVPVSVSDRG